MSEFINVVKSCPLFDKIDTADLKSLLSCLSAKREHYQKDDIILLSGDKIENIGLVIEGSAIISKEDFNGNASIIAEICTGELFAEVFVCAKIDHSPVTVTASESCEVLMINYKKITTMCSSACNFHTRLIENMLNVLAAKTMMLNMKIEILSKRTTREKLMSFFEMRRGKATAVTLPFNREQLAQYLCVDRSAMSTELSKMCRDGLIKINKNEVEILTHFD